LIHCNEEGILVGDEGGFGPKLSDETIALMMLKQAITNAGFKPVRDAAIALDVAATHFYDAGSECYLLKTASGEIRPHTSRELVDRLARLTENDHVISIEDGCGEEDWDGWRVLTERLGSRVQLVGDDLFVTNKVRLKRGIDLGVANSILVKVNQIGSLTETLETMQLAKENGYTTVISHRSGETEDVIIADLAVATNAGQIKTGAPCRGERTAKYNQLLRIEEELGKRAVYAGKSAFRVRRAG
jgi:enolase